MALNIDREPLFALMESQNRWHGRSRTPPAGYVRRAGYLRRLGAAMESQAAVVLTGARRAGKTELLRALCDTLTQQQGVAPAQILYLDLEDYRLAGDCSVELLAAVLELYRERVNPEAKAFFLLDEVQNVPAFERFIRTHYGHPDDIKFVLTGSNSRLLSSDLATLLTGRTLTFEIHPFSFGEFVTHHGHAPGDWEGADYYALTGESWIRALFDRYLTWGGIPEFLREPEPARRLQEYFENVVYRDLIQHSKVRYPSLVHELALYLASNVARPLAVNKLARTLGTAPQTLRDYMEWLARAYLFFFPRAFAFSVKRQARSHPKVYCLDNGLVRVVGSAFSPDRGWLLENLVAVELRRRGHEIFYHRITDSANTGECDFVVRRGTQIVEALQVCDELDDPAVRDREIAGLRDAMEAYDLHDGTLLTRDHFEPEAGDNIRILPVWYWLLAGNGE